LGRRSDVLNLPNMLMIDGGDRETCPFCHEVYDAGLRASKCSVLGKTGEEFDDCLGAESELCPWNTFEIIGVRRSDGHGTAV
jgi:hypothetical protein